MNKISKKMWLLLASVGAVAFVAGYSATASAWHSAWYGYFFHTYDTNGYEVLPPWGGRSGCQGDGWALPGWVDTPSEFINFVVCKLGGSTQERRGAAFIISTMIGQNNYSPSSAQINEFAARVNYAASRGWINFYAVNGCILPNTYYQDAGSGDVAYYWLCGSGVGNGINFYNGSDWYVIKRFCANPVGNMPVLADDINFTMSGSTSVSDTTVYPGQAITFTHNLYNNGPTGSNPIDWGTWGGPSSSGPWSLVASGNAGTFSAGQTKTPSVENYTVPAGSIPNSRICRRIDFTLSQAGGYGSSTPACATVQYNYTLTPTINAAITGISGPVAGSVAEPGDSVTFTYAVNNSGTTQSENVNCSYDQDTHTGYSTATPNDPFIPSGANCAPSRVFPVGNTTIATETVNNLPANRSVCRAVAVGPASFGTSMPAGWTSGDIGAVGIAGSTSGSGDRFTMQASGADVWDTVDEFRYLRKSYSGNIDIRARVTSLSATDVWTKAGVMIRETTANNSSHAFALVTPSNGTAFQRRPSTGAATSHTAGPVATAPYWVRLVRSGNTFTSYVSSNGSTWTAVGSEVIAMTSTVSAGLALVSHNDGALAQAVFENVTVNGVPITTGTTASAQACVHVASKPYARVYGGDISAGGGVVLSPDALDSCNYNSGAGIFGWNRRGPGSWAGAATQFAASAMYTIFDTSTSLGNGAGAAPPASGLAFANTGTNVNGTFGTNFGSVGCIQDYYSRRPATTTSPPTGSGAITAMTTGIYGVTGPVQFYGGGALSAGERITIYVDGNVHVNTNITYGGEPWSISNMPNFQLIVRGDIFIDLATTRLDGLFVAQPRADGTGGTIHTCASTIPTIFTQIPLSGTLASTCDTKLTVNGSFVARQIRLLRTIGTQRSSSAGETASGGNMAEAFNFGPAAWMVQPDSGAASTSYDSITSLPPIL